MVFTIVTLEVLALNIVCLYSQPFSKYKYSYNRLFSDNQSLFSKFQRLDNLFYMSME